MMLYKLVSKMDPSVFSNQVVCMTPLGPLADNIQAAGIPVIGLNMPRGRVSFSGLFRILRFFLHQRPDIIQTWMYHADLFGTMVGKIIRCRRIVWNIRCSFIDLQKYSKLSALVIQICAYLSRVPDTIVCNSHAGLQFHREIGYQPRRSVVIPNGFDLQAFLPDQAARKSLHRELDISDDTICIGMIARFDPMKDFQTFLKAGAHVLQKKKNIHLIGCGDGVHTNNPTFRKWIDRYRLGSHIHLLGLRNPVNQIMAGLDYHVLAAYGEGFPNVIGEAMACGVPCIATDVGDVRQIIGDTGEVVPAGDYKAMGDAIIRLIDQTKDADQALRLKARRRIQDYYSIEKIVWQYEQLYRKMMTRPTDNAANRT